MNLSYKNLDGGVLDVDDKSRRVKVAISEMGSKDHDNDVIDQNAYTKTIKERGPEGKGLIWHLTDHNASLKSAIGRFKELYTQGNQLVGVTDVPDTTLGRDMLEMYKSGHVNQHSVGFSPIRSEKSGKGEDAHTIITEIKLYEGSAVLWGANPNTPTLSAGKSLVKEQEDILKEVEAILKLKSAKVSDEMGELMEVREKQLLDRLQTIFSIKSTQAEAIASPAPESKGMSFGDQLYLLTL